MSSELLIQEALELRDYQHRTRHLVFEAFRQNHSRVCAVMPTGGGKRILAVWMSQFAAEHGRRVLFVTNRRILVQQMFDDARKFGVDHGIIMADTDPRNLAANVLIGSLQTIRSWYLREGMGAKLGKGLPPADLIIIDEAHAALDEYAELVAWYPRAKVLGMTATPVGPDGKPLTPKYYDLLVEGVKNSELIAQGRLLRTHVYAPSEPDIKGVRITKGEEYNQGQLGRKVQECTVFADVFQEWAPFADRKTVVFVPGIAYGNDLARQFNARLGSGQFMVISARTKQAERDQMFAMLKRGEMKGIISVDVMKEGVDLPELSCGIDLQPNNQLRTYWQKIGRIKRECEGQTEAIWLDLAGNYWRFPHPDCDPDWPDAPEVSTADMIKKKRADPDGDPQPIRCPKCSTAYLPKRSPPKCPSCGLVLDGEPVRAVRMGNGKLKHIPRAVKAKREKSEVERRLDKWRGLLFAGRKKGWSLAACAVRLKQMTGDWPKPNWPGVEVGSIDRKRRVTDVLTPQQIVVGCNAAAVVLRKE